MKNSRRGFIQQATLGIATTLAAPLTAKSAFLKDDYFKAESNFPIGFAGYTFLKFDLDKSIEMMKRLNVNYLSVKDFHLPLNSTPDKIKEVLGKLSAANVQVYAVGVIYMKTKEAVDTAFDYAKRVGVPMIVGVPNYDLLDYTEQKVKETGIKIAIHNHGPEDALYPGPKEVYDRIVNRDTRMGLCLDIGHAVRAGVDPSKALKEYKNRILDLHIKDVTGGFKDAKSIEMGRGVIDFVAFAKALKKVNYTGICSIEHEKDMSDPMAGMAESVGYFRGIMKNNT